MSNRSRIGRSSIQAEIGVFRSFQSPRAFFEKKYPTPLHNYSKPVSPPKTEKKITECIFTVGSPEREKRSDHGKSNKTKKPVEGFGEFLHNCYLCKKRLNDKFFMYGYLGAFCSTECREDQMVLDGFEEEIAKDIEMRLKSAQGLFNNKIPNLGLYP